MGNHDAAALRQIGSEAFNPEARRALNWTQEQLTEESVSFLSELPESIEIDSITLTHGSPRHPVWEYLLDIRTATINFEYFSTPYCLVGHTHLPMFYALPPTEAFAEMSIPEPNVIYRLQPRAILNPGSVGQPRDRDPRAAFAILDTEKDTWHYRRVQYEVDMVQKRMIQAGLPERHIQRLAGGW
jgi:diadenosine tetraphosphatase ApaH/serine/threonine PP2A family protein phosphatase